jgi:predicted TPR repeat methyltransferase
MGQSAQGLEWLEKALRVVDTHPDLHNNHGNVLKALGRLDEAEAAYERALTLRPQDPAALSNLGAVARERGQYAHAELLLQDAIAIAPGHYEAYQQLASVFRRQNRLAEALAVQVQALSLRPNHGDAYFKLGATYYALGRIEEAADVYRRWVVVEPQHPVPRHLLAGCTGEGVPERASDEFVRASFDSFARHFDRSLAKLEYRAPELVAGAVASALGVPAANLDVLDAGAGTGLCAAALRPYARKLVAVDLSEAMLQHAQQRGGYDELVVAELSAFVNAAAASYDLVVCTDTLVYFGALHSVMAGFAGALRPAGTLVFTTEYVPEAATEGFAIAAHGRYSHSEPYVRAMLQAAGLEVAHLQHVELRREAGKWVQGLLLTARKP